MGILAKYRNFDQKTKFWYKMGIFTKDRNFDQKSKFWLKHEALVKLELFVPY